MSKFNLAELLADMSELDTGLNQEQIEYIDIDKLHADEKNFYALTGIEQLMSSIELLGLQQPVRVRPEGEGYVIISGHRRSEAIRRLAAEGLEDLRKVPCIVESSAKSPELQELKLIYANSDTRVLSSAELATQAARVKELLYKLKEQGMDFPGRMRDHVAEACKLSKTKLARLEAIENHLAYELKFEYKDGKLNEACAYALSQLPRPDQLFIHEHLKNRKYLYENSIKSMAEFLAKARKRSCPQDICQGKCQHVEALTAKVYNSGYQGYTHCSYKGCCADCPDIGSCASVCPKMKDAAKAKKAEVKEANKKAAAEKAAKELPKIQDIQALWSRFGEARRAAGVSPDEFRKLVGSYIPVKDFEGFEELKAKFTAQTYLPYAGVFHNSVVALSTAAGLFGCSVDYLLCLSDDPAGRVSGSNTAAEWRSGEPERVGAYLCKVACEGATIKSTLKYTGDGWRMYGGQRLDEGCKIVGWWPVPEE